MRRSIQYFAFAAALMAGAAVLTGETAGTDLAKQVAAAERAFAQTMADRDHAAFTAFLSEETVFLARSVLRGKREVAEGWKSLFEGADAPFSWEPETVEVLDSGDLAISTGPVHNPEGTRTSTYTSIWRQEEPGVWRIIFDRGSKYCE